MIAVPEEKWGIFLRMSTETFNGRDPDFRVPNSKRIETGRCPQRERLHRRFVIVLGKALASR